jgi:NAD(P)-dependent dehydrogenase (short-subunit alcohol dehydrogenase family)
MKNNRIVVITGAAGGMGTKFVERFLQNDDVVFAADVEASGLQKLKKKLGRADQLHTALCDISNEGDCNAIADIARSQYGRVDVLVNCAGYFPIKPFVEMTSQEWRRVVDINLTGAFLMCKAIYPLMKGLGWGRIINIGSASTFDGVPGQTHYVAAKAGLFGFTRSLARELGGDGITVNVVTPGLTLTPPVRRDVPAELISSQIKLRAIARDEQPDDLVGAVFFLASSDANFITGQTMNVDGGKHML